MKSAHSWVLRTLSLLRKRVRLFYFLSSIPLVLILYYNPWDLVISFYGFIFLLLKSDKLNPLREANSLQRILGAIILIFSFFIYYVLVLIFPTAGLYGGANYVVYLLGLFLVFFDLSGVKEVFTPLFFVVAALSSSLVAAWLKPFLSPYLGNFANLIVGILRSLGINADVWFSNEPIISFASMSGNFVVAALAYECLGVFSAFVFSIILVVVLSETPSSWVVRFAASVIGIAGTFTLNVGRVIIIFVTDYIYGAEAGATVHYVIGYALFSAWLVLFLYLFSQRERIKTRLSRRESHLQSAQHSAPGTDAESRTHADFSKDALPRSG